MLIFIMQGVPGNNFEYFYGFDLIFQNSILSRFNADLLI